MSRVYLRATGPNSFKWVKSLKKATKDYKKAANATQKQLSNTKLVEVPDPLLMQSKWVISRDK
jgi:hypothetical protein